MVTLNKNFFKNKHLNLKRIFLIFFLRDTGTRWFLIDGRDHILCLMILNKLFTL